MMNIWCVRVQEEYDVDEETAIRDVYRFLRELYIRDIVRNIPELELEAAGKQGEK